MEEHGVADSYPAASAKEVRSKLPDRMIAALFVVKVASMLLFQAILICGLPLVAC